MPKPKFEKERDALYAALKSKYSFSLEALRHEDGSELSIEDMHLIQHAIEKLRYSSLAANLSVQSREIFVFAG